MALFKVVVLSVLITALMSSCTSDQGSACHSDSHVHVNCQLNNIQLLNELIDNRVRSILQMANNTGFKWIPIVMISINETVSLVAGTYQHTIPNAIPDTAREILLYATVFCGLTTRHINTDITFYTMQGDQRFAMYLRMHGWDQQAINTNSDNMWLPMPSNRLVYVQVPSTYSGAGICGFRLSATGYRI